jgi:hypothetical membrane protein
MTLIATLSIIAAILSLICLLTLHFTSSEFKPSWRMISEYAMGKHKWILTLFFMFWSLSTLLTSVLLFNIVTSFWAVFGAILVLISGIGAFMGGLFDVKHKLHGLSFLLGVPTLPIAALIISYYLVQTENWNTHRKEILFSAHTVWVTLMLMGVSMALLFSGFKKAGVPLGPNVAPPKTVPEGVIAINGYANRLLVFCYILWVLIIAKTYLLI